MSPKLLIVGPAWVGDMVMAHTLFQLLKQQSPFARLAVMAPVWSKALLDRMPEVDTALLMPLGHGALQLKRRYQLGCQLREQQYDHAIVLPNSFKSALIPFFAKIPQRTGWLGEMRYGLLNDYRHLDKARYPLMVSRFAALAYPPDAVLPSLPRPCLKVAEASVQAAVEKFHLKRTRPILILCPGAEFGPAKQWPAAHYAVLAQTKLQLGWQVWLMGSEKDQAQTVLIQTMTGQRCLNLAGKTSLAEAVDILSLADMVVSNDSGLMHIAAALNRPVVAVYGATDPGFTPPGGMHVKTLSLKLACSPCFKRTCPLTHLNCMKQLSPERVISAVDELYENINH